MSLFGANYACPRCGKLGFPNEAAARNCPCRSGYATKKCSACRGTGYTYGNSQIQCPKCGGTGREPAY